MPEPATTTVDAFDSPNLPPLAEMGMDAHGGGAPA